MNLSLTKDRLTVCQLPPAAAIPAWATNAPGFSSITRTAEELSIVCTENAAPSDVRQEPGWRAFQVAGPLDFGLTGVLVSIATPLARAGISIFSISTYNTDYVLVKTTQVDAAVQVLRAAGHTITAE
jgi:uncharacterized protein